MNKIDKKFLHEYYEREALTENRQKAMYEGDPWESYWHQVMFNEIFIFFKNIYDGRFLEVGCAEGLYIKLFKDLHPKSTVIGLDIAKNYLLKAKSGIYNGNFIQGDAENLPFKNNSFDVVICSETLEHVIDPKKAFSELVRVSKNYILVSVPGHTPPYYLAKFFGLIKEGKKSEIFSKPGGGHINDLNTHMISKYATESKCLVIKNKTDCYFPPIIGRKLKIPKKMFIPVVRILDLILSNIPIINKTGLVQITIIVKNISDQI